MKTRKPSSGPLNAVAYARYSSAGQRDVSIEQQLSDIRAFASREGYTIVREYSDHARSGYKNIHARTAFQAMLADAQAGSFDAVICWKVDRFGRDREESTRYKGILRRLGIRILYAMEPIPEGSAGILTEGMLESIAQWYSANLSENVTRGMMDNARRCLYNGTRTLGYVRGPDGRYAIQPEEAAVVRQIFSLYCSGSSAAMICRHLKSLGLKTVHGNDYLPKSILRILENERYTGVYLWGTIRIPGGIPAIIDQTTFEEAQKMKNKTSRHIEQGAVDFLLTGKAFCGHCGCPMIGDSGTSCDGTRFYYYTCQSRKSGKGCRKKSIRKDRLESLVVDFVIDYVLSDQEIENTAAVVMEEYKRMMEKSPLAAMESELAEIDRKIRNINDAIANGIWNSSTSAVLKDLEDSADSLRESIKFEKYTQAQMLDRDRVLFFLHRFAKNKNNPANRRMIIKTFINAVYVYDDHLHIVTNNCEGNERYPLAELPPDSPDEFPPDPCSSNVTSGVPTVTHPNNQVTIYRIAI